MQILGHNSSNQLENLDSKPDKNGTWQEACFMYCRKSSTLIVCRAISFPIFAPMPWGKTTEQDREEGKRKAIFSQLQCRERWFLRVSLSLLLLGSKPNGYVSRRKTKTSFSGVLTQKSNKKLVFFFMFFFDNFYKHNHSFLAQKVVFLFQNLKLFSCLNNG